MPARLSRAPAADSDQCVAADATLTRAFDLLGKRWTGVLLATLRGSSVGFRVLSRAIPGISDSVLSDRLSELTNAGLLVRSVDQGPPVSVSYALTEAGAALLPALEQIGQWADHYLPVRGRLPKSRRESGPQLS
ncbi:MAG: helix-turn-helix transcriptional regulator [Actinomycetota bacterium]|nr:helix-turn-helix transcriptional regulator [Actinomycetota bacterium]